jgi:hypothetical protein
MCADGHHRLQTNHLPDRCAVLSFLVQEAETPTTKINNPMEGGGESDEGQDDSVE